MVNNDTWIVDAFELLKGGEYLRLERALSTLSKRFVDRMPNRQRAFWNYFQGRVHFHSKNHEMSLRLMTQAAASFRQVKDHAWHSACHLRIANDYTSTCQWTEANLYYEKALKLVEDSSDAPILRTIVCIDWAASALKSHSGLDAALHRLDNAHRDVGIAFPFLAVKALNNIVALASTNGNIPRAINAAREGIAIMDSTNERDGALLLKSAYLSPSGVQTELADSRSLYASILTNYGNTLLELGEYETASKNYLRALEVVAKIEAADIRFVVCNELARIAEKSSRIDDAFAYYEEAIRLMPASKLGSVSHIIVLQNRAEALFKLGKLEEAQSACNACISACLEYQLPSELVYSERLLGEILLEAGNVAACIAHLQSAAKLSQQAGLVDCHIACLRLLGRANMFSDLSASKQYLSEALLLANKHENFEEEAKIRQVLSAYHAQLKDFECAYEHERLLADLRIRLFNEKLSKSLLNLTVLHQVDTYKTKEALADAKAQRLETELEAKSVALRSTVERIAEKNDLTRQVRSVIQLALTRDLQGIRSDLKSLDLMLSRMAQEDDVSSSIDRILSDYHALSERKLLEVAPDLNQQELKICIMLMAKLSTKQISDALSVSVGHVENSRSRIRKKFFLTSDQSLTKHLQSFR